MALGDWKQPVSVRAGKQGATLITLNDTMNAVQVLMYEWPERGRGPRYAAALRACGRVLSGDVEPETARNAFIAAAEEVDILTT